MIIFDDVVPTEPQSWPAASNSASVTSAPRFPGNRLLSVEQLSPAELHVVSQLSPCTPRAQRSMPASDHACSAEAAMAEPARSEQTPALEHAWTEPLPIVPPPVCMQYDVLSVAYTCSLLEPTTSSKADISLSCACGMFACVCVFSRARACTRECANAHARSRARAHTHMHTHAHARDHGHASAHASACESDREARKEREMDAETARAYA